MLNLYAYNIRTGKVENPPIVILPEVWEDENMDLWLDMEAPTKKESEILRKVFHFHELAIEDCLLAEAEEPKIDDYQDHLFIVTHAVSFSTVQARFETTEVDIFFGKNFVVTFHNMPTPGITALRESLENDSAIMTRGSDGILHAVVDMMVDNYIVSFKKFERYLYEVEAAVFENPDQKALNRLFNIKRTMLSLARMMEPQREIISRLGEENLPFVDEENKPYFRDVHDHMDRIEGLMDFYQDLINGALNTFISLASNRMNYVIKTLTGIAFITLPLTFIASLYGMNFSYMPLLHNPYGFWICVGIMGFLAGGIIWFYKKQRWF